MSRQKSSARSTAPRSQRQLRVGEEIRHALAGVIERGNLRDPALRGRAITVTEVRVSPDLSHATAYVLPLGGGDTALIVKALGHAAPYLRGEVARAINLRHAPEIVFAADASFDTAAHLATVLRRPEVSRDLATPADAGEDDGRDNGA
jgi:ribosome-binding factor A